MRILLIEPFFTGSHRSWAEGFRAVSTHEVQLLTLPGRHWKWRMYGAAVSLARTARELDPPDLILATDMLDLSTFLGLLRKTWSQVPVALYLHENQISYPWSPTDPDASNDRNNQYGFINYTAALAADAVFFNSDFHRKSFFAGLETFLRQFPDHRETDLIPTLEAKSSTLHLGMDLQRLGPFLSPREPNQLPILLWNHRWEYDKDPDTFFGVLAQLRAKNVAFQLVVLGEAFRQIPPVFARAKELFSDRILHWGYAKSWEDYAGWLARADILPVTSRQDFFGGSIVEAIYSGCTPILPRALSYPEHIPPDWQEQHLYTGEAELLEKLEQACRTLPKNPALRAWVARYDWAMMGPEYDRRLEAVVNEFG